MAKVNIKDLLDAGAHFGHQKERWNPKMRPFIFATRDNVQIIDLEKTVEMTEKALDFVNKIAKQNGKILFVATKRQAKDIVKKAAIKSSMPYVVNRWLGGLLTNFGTIRKRIKKLKDLETQREKGEFEKFTKRERIKIDQQIEKLEFNIGGIRDLTFLPDALFVIDTITDEVAVKETKKLEIPIIALCDTNSDPEKITHPIPANDDAIKSIEYFCNLMSSEIKSAKGGEDQKEFKKDKKSISKNPSAKLGVKEKNDK